MSKIEIASIHSLPGPQTGQKHRSSGNFSTEDTPPNTQQLEWDITDNANAGSISFTVMEDKTWQVDPTIFSNVKNGADTNYRSARRLYIADPQNAGDQAFTVTVYALTTGDVSVSETPDSDALVADGADQLLSSVSCEPGPQPGQKHRSSGDFSTQNAPPATRSLRWKIINASNTEAIRFAVWKDVSWGPDKTIFNDLKDGSITDYYSDRQLYIVSNASTTGGQIYTVQCFAVQ